MNSTSSRRRFLQAAAATPALAAAIPAAPAPPALAWRVAHRAGGYQLRDVFLALRRARAGD